MSETRKLAAILAADIVSYSRLAGAGMESSRDCELCEAIPPTQPFPYSMGASSSASAMAIWPSSHQR
jgi:hypothetical protein